MNFRDILGQDVSLKLLQKDIAKSSLPGAYLFTGPSGIGKRMTAISFAKALNCKEKGTDGCNRCSSCIRIESMNHPNLRIINPEGESIKISQIRQLKTETGYKIYEGGKRVWIIDDAEKLTSEAANSLLKILEEPPADLIIILITSIPQILPSTIVSRCRILHFSPLKKEYIGKILMEETNTPEKLIPLISHLAQGSVSEALKLIKEKTIFQEREKIIELIKEKKVESQKIFHLSERWSNQKNPILQTLLNIVIFFLRDILVLKLDSSFPLINQDKASELVKLKDNYSFSELYKGIEAVEKSKNLLQANISTQLTVEGMWIKILCSNTT